MDNLSRDARMAKNAGMSYGQWKAMQKPKKPVKEKPVPEGYQKCECCGKLFKKNRSKKFCSVECREQAYLPRRNELSLERMRKYRQQKGFK